MAARVIWKGREYVATLRVAAFEGMDAAAEVVRSRAMRNVSRTGKFKSFARQASKRDKAFVAKFGFVDPPGGFPRVRTGRLMRSMVWDRVGPLTRRIGPNSTIAYARIHELGGNTGRSHIPARPYLRPALAMAGKRASIEFSRVVRAKMRGVRLPGMDGGKR